jgi:hypothetical protein
VNWATIAAAISEGKNNSPPHTKTSMKYYLDRILLDAQLKKTMLFAALLFIPSVTGIL